MLGGSDWAMVKKLHQQTEMIHSYDYQTAHAIDKGHAVQELSVAVKELVENALDADAKEIGTLF